MRRSKVPLAGLLFLALCVAPQVHGQDAPPTHLSLNTGLFQFDLSGTGLAPMVAVRAATPVSTVLLFEGALLAARPGQQFGETTTFVVPEGQIQLALPFSSVAPYMGLGAGAAFDFRSSDAGGTQVDLTISGALGIKMWLSETTGGQLEFRARGIDPNFTGSSSEFTIGLIWRP